jgi:gamma-glutamyl hydrolase
VSEPSFTDLSSHGPQYIAASYVKFAEAAGARVAPLVLGTDWKTLLPSLSGVLFPGGGASLNHSQYWDAARTAVEYSLMMGHDNPFPVVGHCLGFQVLAIVGAGGDDVDLLTAVAAENISLPLSFTSAAANSSAYGAVPQIRADLATQPLTMNNHHWGVTPDTFARHMAKAYVSLATSVDKNGTTFVAAFESPHAPIYGFQYHPEKSLFEWNPTEQINHNSAAVAAMQYHARLLGDTARLHTPAAADITDDDLIYAHTPVYTANVVPDFEQCYFFDSP